MSPSSSSASSHHGTMASKLRTLALGSKPHVNIIFDDEKRTVYSTMDKLSGKIEIAVSTNTRFEDVEIQFVGSTKTSLEKTTTSPGLSNGVSAFHQFLKLRQPILESCYPQPRIFEPGRTYEFPFVFVIPQQLLPRICKHEVQHQSVHDAHLNLPPSIGGDNRYNDLAPEMCKIQYQVAVRITSSDEVDATLTPLITKMRNIRVIPAVDEQPPIDVQDPNSDFVVRAQKSIKKGVFKGKLGTLVIEAEEPKSLCLPTTYDFKESTVSTMATVKLRFDPVEAKSPPPRLGSLSSKLKASTWHAVSARQNFPKKKDNMFDQRTGIQSTSINLSSRCMGSVEWIFHNENLLEDDRLSRQDSATSEMIIPKYPSPSTKYKGLGFYTAEIVVPVTLPKDKFFVPTFHSCLVSRTYTLNLSLGIHSAGVGFPSVELKLPIQVSAEGISEYKTQARNSMVSIEELEEQQLTNEFFVPSSHDSWAVDTFTRPIYNDLPPEYEAFSRPIVGVAG